MRISIESRKTKTELSNTIANQNKGKYHRQPRTTQSKQANYPRRENLVSQESGATETNPGYYQHSPVNFSVYNTEDLEVPELHLWRYIKAIVMNSVIFFYLIGMRWCLTETKKLKQQGYILAYKCFKKCLTTTKTNPLRILIIFQIIVQVKNATRK